MENNVSPPDREVTSTSTMTSTLDLTVDEDFDDDLVDGNGSNATEMENGSDLDAGKVVGKSGKFGEILETVEKSMEDDGFIGI